MHIWWSGRLYRECKEMDSSLAETHFILGKRVSDTDPMWNNTHLIEILFTHTGSDIWSTSCFIACWWHHPCWNWVAVSQVSIISRWICIRKSLSNYNSTILMNLYQTIKNPFHPVLRTWKEEEGRIPRLFIWPGQIYCIFDNNLTFWFVKIYWSYYTHWSETIRYYGLSIDGYHTK